MIGSLGSSAAIARLKSRAFGTTALTVLAVMATPAAWAAPPTSGTLPGAFSSNLAPTYSGASSTAATIATVAGNNVLQWGGTALANKVTPGGTAFSTNPGFSIGSGATLTINGAATSVLVNDLSGSPSQVFGALNAGALGGPLYVSNTNGVIVAASGAITVPVGGIGLLGYAVNSGTFAGTVSVNNSTAGTGGVTVTSGATITGAGPLLVASNGTVNIGAVGAGVSNVVAGFTFTTAAGNVTPTVGVGLTAGASSVVNVTPAAANATLTIGLLSAGGAVNNSANLTLPVALRVAGLFTNSGVLNDNDNMDNNQLAGGLSNSGVVNEALAAGLTIRSNGNVQSTGVLNVPTNGALSVLAANVEIDGSVTANKKALSTTNALNGFTLTTLGSKGTVAVPGIPQTAGVANLATTIFTGAGATIQGNAIRILTNGNIFATAGDINLFPGTNAAAVADPFNNLKSLNYTFSLFPGTVVQTTVGNINIGNFNNGDTSFSNSPGVNLNGTLSTLSATANINVAANNINSNNGPSAGFSVPNQSTGAINLIFFGNVNNPSATGPFQNRYVPVTVGANGTKAGTANITLSGPSSSSATDQNVNLLVQGNVQLANGSGLDPVTGNQSTPLVAPSLPTAVLSSYANNHLVVTATGNIGFSPSLVPGLPAPVGQNIFYWPGLVWLTSGATASNPSAAPNNTATIALGNTGTTTSVNLFNLIPADLTKPDVSGQTGNGGVHFLSGAPTPVNLSPGSNFTATTTISSDSWVNFLTAADAAAYQTASGSQFKGGVISSNTINAKTLPAAAFQP